MIANKKLFNLAGLTILVGLIMVSSCKNDDDTEVTFDLPPAESLLMDFSDFSNPDDTLGGKKAFETLLNGYTYGNWGYSYITVAFWNTIAAITLAIPVSCYGKTLEARPVYKGDNTWEWTATYTSFNGNFDARLTAVRISNSEYTAAMFISKEGETEFTDFKWFEGVIRFDRTHAIWALYESPVNPVHIVDIEWNKNWETDTGSIRYTYVKENTDLEGSFIEFKLTDDPTYNASYAIDFKGDNTSIEWDTTGKNGHVKDFRKFGDNYWHCWNELLQDISCE